MAHLISNVKQKFGGNSPEKDSSSASTPTNNDSGHFRKIKIPEAKVGLGSTEGDLLVMLRKYLEIVGLVVIVWIIGK